MMGTSAVVATSIPEAVGYSLGMKMQNKDVVVVCFFGDGATGEGVFHESLNLASIKSLPILFVCENNDLAIYSRLADRAAQNDLTVLAEAHNIPSERLNDDSLLQLRERSADLVRQIRGGGGPRFLECMTYRWKEHVGPDDDWHLAYREGSEASKWRANDQVLAVGQMLTTARRRCIEEEIEREIDAAIQHAEQSPFPGQEELLRHVYK